MRNWVSYTIPLLLLLVMLPLKAQQVHFEQSQLFTVQHQLVIDKKSQELAENQMLHLKKNRKQLEVYYKKNGVDKSTIKQAQIDILSAQASLDGIKMAIDSTKEQVSRLKALILEQEKEKSRLQLLKSQEQVVQPTIKTLKEKLTLGNALLAIQAKRLKILTSTRSVLSSQLSFRQEWLNALMSIQMEQRRQAALRQSTEAMEALQQQLDAWIIKLSALNDQIRELTSKGVANNGELQSLNLQLLQANEHVELTRLDVYLLSLQNDIRTAADTLKLHGDVSHLNGMTKLVDKTQSQLKEAAAYVTTKLKTLAMKKDEFTGNQKIAEKATLLSILKELETQYHQKAVQIIELSKRLDKVKLQVQKLVAHQISMRQDLPGFDLSGWVDLIKKSRQIPAIFWQFTKSTAKPMAQLFEQLSPGPKTAVVFLGLLVLLAWYVLRYWLGRAKLQLYDSRERFTANIMYTVVMLARRTLLAWFCLVTLVVVGVVTGLSLNLFIYLLAVYIIFKTLVNTARLTLLESITDVGGSDVRLYYQLKWALILGGLLTAVIVISHSLPVPYEVMALTNRLFMFFVFLVGLLLLQGRHFLPMILESKLTVRRRYVFHALRVLNYLLPLALISNAIVGLFGYVDLAWTIAKMQGVFLMVLAAYLILRGLVIDFVDYASEIVIKRAKHGWVWTEAFFKPVDKILRITIFILAVFALLHAFGLDSNVAFVNTISGVMNYKLFGLAGNDITPLFFLKFAIFVVVLYWASRWTREFSIRWWYLRFKDLGVRNSLSIFTQYTVVIVGVLIGLQIIGIDLKGFAVVAAAFAAGMGFGLRDMANNYFSGVLLLIERPFRRGDIIKLGEFEGEVVHQGMRSTMVRTWDHMEVIVPNSEMFTKSFVNWTHQDRTVRSLITLHVCREDSPHVIQALVCDVLSKHPAVLSSPEPDVLMKEISESLIQMEVRYFMMLSPEHSRVKTRSEVLFAIWDCFKDNNIKPPYPNYDVRLHNQPALTSE